MTTWGTPHTFIDDEILSDVVLNTLRDNLSYLKEQIDLVGGSSIIPLVRGGAGVDLSASGPGFLKQATTGANVTVSALLASDLPSHSTSLLTSGILALARGGVGADLSTTGGTGQVVKQSTLGGVLTVGLLTTAELPALSTTLLTSGVLGVTRGGTGVATGSANLVFSTPSGASGAPSFRALVSADLPNLDTSKITTGQLSLARGGTGVDLNATGGTGQYLKQSSVGAGVSVGTIPYTDLTYSGLSVASVLRASGGSSAAFSFFSYSELVGVPTTFAPSSHTIISHTASGLTAGQVLRATGASTFAWQRLVAGDLPTHTHAGADITSGTVAAARLGAMSGATSVAAGASGAVPSPVAGDDVKYLRGDGAWATPAGGGGGGGSVTSVALTVPSMLAVSGSPVTTSGTLAITLATQSANTFLSGPTSGGAVAPTFRTIALSELTGTLALAAGGTGQTTASTAFGALSPLTTRGDVLTRDATAHKRLPLGAAATYLRSDATDALWSAIQAGDLPSHSASLLTSGTVADARLTSNVPLLNAANVFTGINKVNNQMFVGPVATGPPSDNWKFVVKDDGTNKGIRLINDTDDNAFELGVFGTTALFQGYNRTTSTPIGAEYSFVKHYFSGGGILVNKLSGSSAAGQIDAADLINSDVGFYKSGTKVLGASIGGWADPTGTASRATFATSTVTLAQLAGRVMQLTLDLKTHGMIKT